MSYERHYGRGASRKRYNRDRGEKKDLALNHLHLSTCIDDHDDRRHQETPDEILKNVILRLGEVVST